MGSALLTRPTAIWITSLLLAISMAWAGMIFLQRAKHPITDQELLRQLVEEWKLEGEPGSGPNKQIFEQQAAQGYYEEALDTARLFKRTDDLNWSITELARIRAENGDIEGSKAMVKRVASRAWEQSFSCTKVQIRKISSKDCKHWPSLLLGKVKSTKLYDFSMRLRAPIRLETRLMSFRK